MIKSTFLLFLGWYEINLDKRKLRTPHGNIFRVPSEPLALAVATEWNSQGDIVNRHAMHLVSRKILFLYKSCISWPLPMVGKSRKGSLR